MSVQREASMITPETRIADLIKNFPELEKVLISVAPEFAKLRNPVLRRTVARVATLGQAAKIGKLSVTELIDALRREAGLEKCESAAGEEPPAPQNRPRWLETSQLRKSFDARPVIDASGSPLSRVLSDVRDLEPGQRFELVTPLLPAPLINILKRRGFLTWTEEEQPRVFRTHVTPEGSGP